MLFFCKIALKRSDTHHFAAYLPHMIKAIKHSGSINAHPLKEGHHTCIV